MALLRKKNREWKPSEKTDLEVGDTIEIDDYKSLVELGMADLVDENGKILPLPGTIFVCGICFEQVDSHEGYVDHIVKSHANISTEPAPVEVEEQEEEEPEDEPIVKESFGEKMKKARAAAKAKREAQKK